MSMEAGLSKALYFDLTKKTQTSQALINIYSTFSCNLHNGDEIFWSCLIRQFIIYYFCSQKVIIVLKLFSCILYTVWTCFIIFYKNLSSVFNLSAKDHIKDCLWRAKVIIKSCTMYIYIIWKSPYREAVYSFPQILYPMGIPNIKKKS